MNTTNEVRDFLVRFKPAQVDINRLRIEVEELQRKKPEIFQDYLFDQLYEVVDEERLHWNQKYFSDQKTIAGMNFSRKRLDHLVDVIEYGRKKGWEGFVVHTEAESQNSTKSSFTGYRPSKSIELSINEMDLMGVRIGLSLEFSDKRLDGAALRDALRWTKLQIHNLCEPYMEKDFCGPMDQDRDHWSSNYFFTQAVYLNTSFTEERFLHMVDVRDYLRERGEEGFVPVREQAREHIEVNTPKTDYERGNTFDNNSTDTPRPPVHDPDHLNKLWLILVVIAAGGAVVLLLLLLAQRNATPQPEDSSGAVTLLLSLLAQR